MKLFCKVGDTFFLVAIEWGTREVVGLEEEKKVWNNFGSVGQSIKDDWKDYYVAEWLYPSLHYFLLNLCV